MSEYERVDGRRSGWARGMPGVLLIGLLLPFLAAGVVLWSTSDRQDALDKIPVAVVNDDTIITSPQQMAAGRALTASLTDPSGSSSWPNLDWILTDADDAADGLRDGGYYAVLTIPSDFSSAIISTGTDSPKQGRVTLQANAAASATMPQLSAQIAAAAADALGQQSTQGYLKNVYAGFNQLAQGNQQAASSAAQLAEGTSELATGAASLDDGAESLASGLDDLATASAELATASGTLTAGAAGLATGASGVATGAGALDDATTGLARSLRGLARGGDDLAGASDLVARAASVIATGDTRLAARAKTLATDLRTLRRDCREEGGSVRFCRSLRAAHRDAAVLRAGTALGERASSRLARASRRAATGTEDLARDQGRAATGASTLAGAAGTLAAGAREVRTGAASLATGAAQLDTGADALAGAAAQSAEGAGSLAEGTESLDSSAAQIDDGAQSLSDGLAKAAKDSPSYSTAQQDSLVQVVSRPVVLSDEVQHDQHGNGWLVAAIIGMVLWLGAWVATQRVDRTAFARYDEAPVASRRLALAQIGPALGLAVAQALAVCVAVLVFHPSLASPVALALLCVAAAVTFTMIAAALRLAMGTAGVVVLVLLLLLQIAAFANVVPLESAPPTLQALNGVLPLSAFTNGASQLVSGGEVASLTGVFVVLAVWSLAAYGLAVTAVKRGRVVRLSARPA